MEKKIIAILSLAIALIISNSYWLFKIFDAGVTQAYQSVSLEDNKFALEQLIRIFPLVIKGASKSEVIAAADIDKNPNYIFEKDGATVVGKIGIIFDKNGKVLNVIKAWDGGH